MKRAALILGLVGVAAYIAGMIVAHNLAEATGFVFGEVR